MSGTKQFVVQDALETTMCCRRIEGVVVDAHHEGGVRAGGRSRDDHPRCTSVDVRGGLVTVVEDPGGLDHDVDPAGHPMGCPWDRGRRQP